jgi:cell division protein FtsL
MAANHRQHAPAAPGFWSGTTLPIVLLAAAMLVGLAALLPLVQTSGATTTAGHIRQLEQERADWQAQLREQELRVAQLGSLARIEKEARERLKMVPPTDIRYIRVDAPAPAPHRLPSRFWTEEEESSTAGSSLWQDLAGWLPVP